MNLSKAMVAFAFAATLCGCASVTPLKTPDGMKVDGVEPVETVEVTNSAWYLFSCIPLFSGDPDHPNVGACKFFQDTLTLPNQMKMLEDEARRVGATRAIDITTNTRDESILFFVLKHWRGHTSAVLVK